MDSEVGILVPFQNLDEPEKALNCPELFEVRYQMANKRIPILICIDAEIDERRADPNVPVDWEGFEKSYQYYNELRARLQVATGAPVHFSWFLRMDPQITHVHGSPDWVVTRYPELIEGLAAAGDELGLHVHANRWDEEAQEWIADFENQEWVDHCVRSSFKAFETSLDRRCRSFRFGDRWMNTQTMNLLESLGVQFDLTAEFGAPAPQMPGEIVTGVYPDYTRIPQLPYHPSRNDFTKPSFWQKRDVWIVPVSAGSIEPSTAVPKRRWPSWRASQQSSPVECMSLILSFDPSIFASVADRLLSDLKTPYLALPARTDFAIAPYQRSNLERNTEYLLSHPQLKDFIFETPREAIQRFN
jgi:hypothetical protein